MLVQHHRLLSLVLSDRQASQLLLKVQHPVQKADEKAEISEGVFYLALSPRSRWVELSKSIRSKK